MVYSYIAVAIGGIFGCLARFGLTQLIQSVYGNEFPLATFCINVIGCFFMGFFFYEMLDKVQVTPALRAGVLTGVIGGFTTFSTFGMETINLIEGGQTRTAFIYLSASVVCGLTAVIVGAYIARRL